MAGTRRSELKCSTCDIGYKLRRDGTSKHCDCAPGLYMDGNTCKSCTPGSFCPGGDALGNSPQSDCPDGLATTFAGAKSEAQCFTEAGYGRVATKQADGKVSLTGVVCPVGTYNVGKNTAGCQKCGAGLTTAGNTTTVAADCVAPAGSYLDKGIGKLCQRGTYSTALNSASSCTPCPDGITTEAEGSDNSNLCILAAKGHYINPANASEALECDYNTYQDEEAAVTECKPCPHGWKTKEKGATGVALCLAPPGFELVGTGENDTITECAEDWYKADWNRNACVKCGTGIITAATGSVSKDACLVPAGYGLVSLNPMVAEPCKANTYGHAMDRVAVANARCTACPMNMFTLDVLNNEARVGLYTSEAACLVQPGWGTTSTIPQQCPVGTFNAGKNRLPCQQCPAGMTTEAVEKTSDAACVVQPGWAMGADGIPAPCDKGSYSIGGTEGSPNGTCVDCDAPYSTQEDEATAVTECAVCAPGYGGSSGDCAVCGYGTFSYGGGSKDIACQTCAAGSTSAQHATHPQQCYSTLIDARKDVFAVTDEATYVSEPLATSASQCGTACTDNSTCVMYRFDITDTETGTGTCKLFPETALGTFEVGFKVADGADYVIWKVDQAVGTALATQPQAAQDATTEVACMAACNDSAECEGFQLSGAECTLMASDLEQNALSMFQVRGVQLYSDRPYQA